MDFARDRGRGGEPLCGLGVEALVSPPGPGGKAGRGRRLWLPLATVAGLTTTALDRFGPERGIRPDFRAERNEPPVIGRCGVNAVLRARGKQAG